MHFQNGSFHRELRPLSVQGDPVYILVTDFCFIIVIDSVAHSSVGIRYGPRALVHHAVGLKRIEKKVIEHPVQFIIRVVMISELLFRSEERRVGKECRDGWWL